jgi:LysM repeat protein
MNTQSPLVPQGTFLEQRNKGRARVKIAVFVVLAIHGIGLLALLMQGCKKEPDTNGVAGADQTNTNAAPAFLDPTNMPSSPPTTQTNLNTPPEAASALSPAVAGGPTDYKVQRGDTFSTIAKKYKVTSKAIQDANPGVDPTKLQINQTLHIPAPAMPTAPGTTAAVAPDSASGEQVYTVKSGDTLIGIAGNYKVSVKALRSFNSLTTDRIRVGQKLRIPVSGTAATGALTSAAPATATAPSGQ